MGQHDFLIFLDNVVRADFEIEGDEDDQELDLLGDG
jgi:hypothetical protein